MQRWKREWEKRREEEVAGKQAAEPRYFKTVCVCVCVCVCVFYAITSPANKEQGCVMGAYDFPSITIGND